MNYENAIRTPLKNAGYIGCAINETPDLGCAKLAPDGVLISALVRLQELTQRVHDARYLLGQTINCVFGPTPEECSDAKSVGTAEASGLGGAMHLAINSANWGLDVIDTDLRRLLNSVGG